MALVNKLRKLNGYSNKEAKADIVKCYNAIVYRIEHNIGNVAEVIKDMLNVEPSYIYDIFRVGRGDCIVL